MLFGFIATGLYLLGLYWVLGRLLLAAVGTRPLGLPAWALGFAALPGLMGPLIWLTPLTPPAAASVAVVIIAFVVMGLLLVRRQALLKSFFAAFLRVHQSPAASFSPQKGRRWENGVWWAAVAIFMTVGILPFRGAVLFPAGSHRPDQWTFGASPSDVEGAVSFITSLRLHGLPAISPAAPDLPIHYQFGFLVGPASVPEWAFQNVFQPFAFQRILGMFFVLWLVVQACLAIGLRSRPAVAAALMATTLGLWSPIGLLQWIGTRVPVLRFYLDAERVDTTNAAHLVWQLHQVLAVAIALFVLCRLPSLLRERLRTSDGLALAVLLVLSASSSLSMILFWGPALALLIFQQPWMRSWKTLLLTALAFVLGMIPYHFSGVLAGATDFPVAPKPPAELLETVSIIGWANGAAMFLPLLAWPIWKQWPALRGLIAFYLVCAAAGLWIGQEDWHRVAQSTLYSSQPPFPDYFLYTELRKKALLAIHMVSGFTLISYFFLTSFRGRFRGWKIALASLAVLNGGAGVVFGLDFGWHYGTTADYPTLRKDELDFVTWIHKNTHPNDRVSMFDGSRTAFDFRLGRDGVNSGAIIFSRRSFMFGSRPKQNEILEKRRDVRAGLLESHYVFTPKNGCRFLGPIWWQGEDPYEIFKGPEAVLPSDVTSRFQVALQNPCYTVYRRQN